MSPDRIPGIQPDSQKTDFVDRYNQAIAIGVPPEQASLYALSWDTPPVDLVGKHGINELADVLGIISKVGLQIHDSQNKKPGLVARLLRRLR